MQFEVKSNFNLIPLGTLEYKLHGRVCPILRHGSWGLNSRSSHPSAMTVGRGLNSKRTLGKAVQSPKRSPPEKAAGMSRQQRRLRQLLGGSIKQINGIPGHMSRDPAGSATEGGTVFESYVPD